MAFATINYFSNALRKASSFNVIFPEDADTPRPWSAFYLLHGLSDDHTIWMRRTSIERYVAGLPLVVVMPDGGRGWYSNAIQGDAYEDDLLGVVTLVDRTLPVKADRSGRAIGGLSMGGYGAVKIGLKHHDRFASVNSHSGALGFVHGVNVRPEIKPEFGRIFGPEPANGPEDPFSLVEQIDHGLLPKIRIDCGTEDFLLDQNRSFRDHLDRLGIPVEYEEFPGGHDWSYWDDHVPEAVNFHARNLGLR